MFGYRSPVLEVSYAIVLQLIISRENRDPLNTARYLTNCSALFKYPGFAVSYESGWDEIPRFDASIEVFGRTKTVKICYDTPYVKGLPTTMVVRQLGPNGEYIESTVRKTYEDPFTLEMKELYEAVVNENKIIKTTATDAVADIKIFQMIMKTGYEQSL